LNFSEQLKNEQNDQIDSASVCSKIHAPNEIKTAIGTAPYDLKRLGHFKIEDPQGPGKSEPGFPRHSHDIKAARYIL
jgi:hypothetical protein